MNFISSNMNLSILFFVMIFLSAFQSCWAGEVADVSDKDVDGPYEFDKFYDDRWEWKGYTETDREVCQELPKLLNSLHPEPMVCTLGFPDSGEFKSIEWLPVEKSKALAMEKIWSGRSHEGPRCGVASTNISLNEKQVNDVNEGDIFYKKSVTDIDNDGDEDPLLKRMRKGSYCNKNKEFITPRGADLIYLCIDDEGGIQDMKAISSTGGFRYRDKQYLFSWNGTKSNKAYLNINEYVKAKVGNEVRLSTREICRIKYNNWGE